MDKQVVIQALCEHQEELREAGIAHLSLFGSVARGDQTATSDIDLMAEFDRTKRLTLMTMAHIENRLTDLLGARVDLANVERLRGPVRARVVREAIHAF